jgi:hypothetical protein
MFFVSLYGFDASVPVLAGSRPIDGGEIINRLAEGELAKWLQAVPVATGCS